MKIEKGYKIKLKPNKEQIKLIENHINTARFIYNYSLNLKESVYKKDKINISAYDIQKEITKLKKSEVWLKETSAYTLKMETLDLEKAYKSFYNKKSKYPKYKRKNKAKKVIVTEQIDLNLNQTRK